ncbi:glycosyltransferase [Candidatus Nitrospira bockiana]
MRIALINSPSLTIRPVSRSMAGGLGFDGGDQMLLPPLDLAMLAATLRAAGDSVEIVDADPLGLDAAGVLARLSTDAWDAIIATVSLPTLEQDAGFLAALRQRHPNTTIAGKTWVRDDEVLRALLESSGAHLVIHGEADLTIPEIVRGRSRAGTAWLEREPDGKIVLRSEPGEPVSDLNRLPCPARDLLPNDRYRYPLLGGPVATLQTSRGCPYPCGYYCPYPLVEGVKWRAQTPERIAAELKEVVERYGLTKVYFRDATFTLNQARVVRLCELILEAGWKLEWVCETRVDCLGETVLDHMKRAGCVGILIGVETGDEQVMHLRDGKKGLTVPKLARVREKTAELGIRLHFLLIVGLPQETRESIVATYDLIRRHQPDTIGVTIITPYPGTPLYRDGLREGWIDSRQWRDYGGHQVPMHTAHLTGEELIAGKRFLEDGFAIMQRRRVGGHSRPLEALAERHYVELLRWAYRLDGLTEAVRRAVPAAPLTTRSVQPAAAVGPNAEKGAGAKPLISVVMPTFNRRAILRKTLLAYAAQTVPADHVEVIVVDDGSSDDTVAMVKRFQAPYRLRLLTQRHGGANAARNEGIRAATAPLVLMTGDDMIPEPAFLEAHLKFHERHPSDADAMLGFIDWSPELSVTPFMRYITAPDGGQQFAFHEVKQGKADFRLFYTSNVSVKRRLLLAQPVLFDPAFTYPAYDDVELGYRLARQGMQLHYNPLAVVCHHHPMTPEGFAARQRKAGHMAMIFARKHPELTDSVLGIGEILRRPPRRESALATLLAAITELEKPALDALNAIQVNGRGYGQVYTQAVLHPVYHALLDTAYALGVREAGEGLAAASHSGRAARGTVSIIVPVFNKVDLTRQCLTHLAAATTGVEYEVIVVDNASTDDTRDFLETLGGDVRVLHNEENRGFAAACNQGASLARGTYLVFLNNDTIPLDGWLSPLVEEVERHPDVGAVGSKLLYADGTIQHAGVVFSRLFFSPFHVYRQFPADAPEVNRRREFQAVTAACMLVRRSLFESVGGFDEGYRNGFEDVDLCLKLREQGARIVYQPQSVLYHLESQTPGRKDHDRENALRLLRRWGHHWWLPDEDLVTVPDGYVYRSVDQEGLLTSRLERLSEADRPVWEQVAAVQDAARRRDLPGVQARLAEPERWPADPSVLRWVAHLCGWAGVPGSAEAFWRRLVKLEDAADARCALAKTALEGGRLEEAREQLERALATGPDHGDAWLLRGVLLMQEQAYAGAEAAFSQAIASGADRGKARKGLGMAAIGQGHDEAAWDHFVRALGENPDDAEALHWLLRVGSATARWHDLFEAVRRFTVRNPGDLSARYALAGVALRLGRKDDARKEWAAIRLLDPHFDGIEALTAALDREACPVPHGG